MITLKRLIGRYWKGADLSPAFLKTGQTAEVFQEVGKHLSFRQRLNSLARIGESSGLICLSTTTGILSGPVAFVESSSLMSFEICPAVTLRSQTFSSVTGGKSGGKQPRSSRVEWAANLEAKRLALSVDEMLMRC